jgi:hypothetical protein
LCSVNICLRKSNQEKVAIATNDTAKSSDGILTCGESSEFEKHVIRHSIIGTNGPANALHEFTHYMMEWKVYPAAYAK